MMNIYKVEIEMLDSCTGCPYGVKVLGHYATKELADRVAEAADATRNWVVEGKARVVVIKVNAEA